MDHQLSVRPGDLLDKVLRDIVKGPEVRGLGLHPHLHRHPLLRGGLGRRLGHLDHLALVLLPHRVHFRRGLTGGQQQK